MGLHLGRKGANRAAEKTGFAAIEGHRSLIDRVAIQKSNEAVKKARLVKQVSVGVSKLAGVLANHRARKTAGKILSQEE